MTSRFSDIAKFGEVETISNAVLTINLVIVGLAATTVVAVIDWLRRTDVLYKPCLLHVGSVILFTALGISAGLLLTLTIDGWPVRVLVAAGTYTAITCVLARSKPEEARLFPSIAAESE